MGETFEKIPEIMLSPFLKGISKFTKKNFISLLYHAVSDHELLHLKNLYNIRNVSSFKLDMEQILKVFKPVSLSEVIESVENNRPFSRPSFLLTFDDGLRECFDVVAPVLLEKGIPAVFFINSGFIGNKDLFFRFKVSLLIEKMKSKKFMSKQFQKKKNMLLKYSIHENVTLDQLADSMEIDYFQFLRNQKPYMDAVQIQKLLDWGFDIGSHSLNHALFSDLCLEDQIDQVLNSIQILENQFQLKNKVFAFPFTDHGVSRAFFEKVYSNGLQLSFGTAGIKNDTFSRNIQRIPAEEFTTAQNAITWQYLYYCLKMPLQKNQIHR